jgi:hypothetical protein
LSGLSNINGKTMTLRTTILWVLAAAYAAALVANIAFGLPIPIGIVILLSVVFALVHGAARYGWRGIAALTIGDEVFGGVGKKGRGEKVLDVLDDYELETYGELTERVALVSRSASAGNLRMATA